MTLHEATDLGPLVKKVTVPVAPARAFEAFTAEMSTWWPLRTHSIGADAARRIEFGGEVGAEITEYGDDGPIGNWGTISAWEPPDRVAFSWHPGDDPSRPTQVEVRFVPVAEGTEVVLTHTDWHLRPNGATARAGYESGWTAVLTHYVQALTT